MHRGCISLGQTQCDDCHRVILYLERYLIAENAEKVKSCLCLDCSLKKGYAGYKQDKGEQVLTIFVE